ncbi:protein of unknown function [Candidatus Filomicrobium marinum]|uniref:Uncharacterized protein n=1 Tax=Candidatus Filomicrobium marinum TaxID=1608628 RepID=A0A0D6JKI8_9HYPH|nr:protein of unknown function [Candidatus Filomicrobium marinum]CPR22175.1 protein of unknown function [Candidatus Filomicrobium marinum]
MVSYRHPHFGEGLLPFVAVGGDHSRPATILVSKSLMNAARQPIGNTSKFMNASLYTYVYGPVL